MGSGEERVGLGVGVILVKRVYHHELLLGVEGTRGAEAAFAAGVLGVVDDVAYGVAPHALVVAVEGAQDDKVGRLVVERDLEWRFLVKNDQN